MSLISLTYVSFASRDMTEDDLKDILTKARDKNGRLGITGLLLYRDRYFIQALEGEEDVVTELYDVIAEDPRHGHVLTVGKDQIEKRAFGSWEMGFKNLDSTDLSHLEGYSSYLDEPFDESTFVADPSRAKHFLNLFRSGANY